MARRFLDKKTHPFYFLDGGERKRYVLIYGDEVDTLTAPAPSGAEFRSVRYRGRVGEMKSPPLTKDRSLEMYFLDVGQGDAAFIVTPNNTKILVDGGLRDRALGFLIWKYRLDRPNTSVTIDHLILSHADSDHVEGLIPLIKHPKITVRNIRHNGIGVFDGGFDTDLGDVANGQLTTLHHRTNELAGLQLGDTFGEWIAAVDEQNIDYRSVHFNDQAANLAAEVIDVGDDALTLELVGPLRNANGTLDWFSDKSHTINGHSLVFRLVHKKVRAFFSGDLNKQGSKRILDRPNAAARLDSHIFKSPHHGSHEFRQKLFTAVRPMVTVVSSGDSPDHGHPRALFLGGVGLAGRSSKPLVFSTELAATFVDAGDDAAEPEDDVQPTTLGDLDFSKSASNTIARRRFKKTLPGIINVRSSGDKIYAARRVAAGYPWESY